MSRRNRMNSRLSRQSSAIQDLMYSVKNMVAVEEEIAQFDYIFKQLMLVHQEYHSLLDEEKKPTDEEWLEEVDERVFTFKHQVHNWLRDAEMERANTSRQSSKKGIQLSFYAAQEAPRGQKQATVVVILTDHQRRELWKRKPN